MRYFLMCLACVGFALTAQANQPGPFWDTVWPRTDFSKTSVQYREVISGGVPKDGIPAINAPEFKQVSAAAGLPAREPVMVLELPGQAPRAYPVRYLIWHEIVNDVVGDVPVAVTYCPLCNSGLVFDRRIGGQVLEFGVSGMLRHSDMIMFDRESESWWQQFTGEAIVGDMLGQKLTALPAWLEAYSDFAGRNPDGLLMQEPVGFRRDYGRNPYAGYDSSPRPFLFNGEMPPHDIPPLSRVVKVGTRAWPLARLAEAQQVTEAGVTLRWRSGMASALDARTMANGRDVGTVRVVDAATGDPVAHEVVFAFAFHAFHPDGTWMLGE